MPNSPAQPGRPLQVDLRLDAKRLIFHSYEYAKSSNGGVEALGVGESNGPGKAIRPLPTSITTFGVSMTLIRVDKDWRTSAPSPVQPASVVELSVNLNRVGTHVSRSTRW